MSRQDFAFLDPPRVRWAEVDRQGVVFNPQYFAYFDVAVTEYWRALGVRYPEDFSNDGTDTYAFSARADFRGSAVYDDLLDLGRRVGRIGPSYGGDRAASTRSRASDPGRPTAAPTRRRFRRRPPNPAAPRT